MTKFEEKKKEAYEKASMKSYGNIDGSRPMRYLLNELENAGLLKEKQALPVVPECVAEWYESHGESSESLEFYIYLFCGKFYSSRDSRKNRELTNFEKWFGEDKNKPIETLIRMQDGYTVEKPQLFYLKNKLTTSYLILDTSTGYFEHWSSTEATGRYKSEFTQAEIDSMQTGSYELVPVEV